MRWLQYILYIVVKRSNLTRQCEMEYAIIAHGFAAHFSVDAQTKEHGNHQFLINPAEQQHHQSQQSQQHQRHQRQQQSRITSPFLYSTCFHILVSF